MNLKINPIKASLNGEIKAPASKSYSHRAFIAASLADGISIIKNPLINGDVGITIDLLRALGIKILKRNNNSYIIKRSKDAYKKVKKPFDCRNSGTTIRIFSALSLLVEGGLTFKGEFLRLNRPILPLLKALEKLGASYKMSGNKLKISRKEFLCDNIKIQGNISSQFISALLILCPLLKCKDKDFFEILVTPPLISKPFIEITLDVLESFGINIQANFQTGTFYIANEQNYRSQSFEIPGDFSSSSNIIAATVLSKTPSTVIINNLNFRNKQGDKKIVEILKKMGASIQIDVEKNQVIINGDLQNHPLKGIEIDCIDIPDLFPILTVIGAFAEGMTILQNISTLKFKETNRVSAMITELSKMGVKVVEEDNKITIFKCDTLKGITINHNNDHRIAMACIIACLYAETSSYIEECEIVNDSYPSFFKNLKELGVEVEQF